MTGKRVGWVGLGIVGVSMCVACAPEGEAPPGGSTPVWTGDASTAPVVEICDNGIDDDHDGLFDCRDLDCGGRPQCIGSAPPSAVPPAVPPSATPPSSVPPDMSCASMSAAATPVYAPVDIVWIVDSSGSMRDEALRVQDNMNALSSAISAAGIDHHVVVISDPDYVRVPPPLGSDPSRYLLVPEDVDSNAPLELLLGTHSRYAHFLRPDAITHVVAVTDDDSSLGAVSFESSMRGLLGHAFTFHAIASPGTELLPCIGGFTSIAAAPGVQYWNLADMTGGLKISICTPDWSTVFGPLGDAIAASSALPCVYDLPAPPVGMSFDAMRVNVVRTPADGSAIETVPNVGDASRCGATGWHYDVPSSPRRIELCPSTCAAAASSVRLDITLGCETLLI